MDVIEGRAFIQGKLQQACIGFEAGKIVKIKKMLTGESHYDFGTLLVLPASIDPHVHFRDPGMTKKEDWSSGSMAALFAGVATVLDMPNTIPPAVMRSDVLEKKAIAAKKSWTDFGVLGGCSAESNPMRTFAEVPGFKVFMSSTTGSVLLRDDKDIKRVLDTIRPLKKPVSVHAEDDHLITKEVETKLADHHRNRPPQSEAAAIERLAKLAPDMPINICHVTCRKALDALARTSFTSEATAHHLFLDLTTKKLGTFGKTNPPLRPKEDREALFKAFAAGKISMLGSDHAPHLTAEKEQEFDAAPCGVPGVETALPLLLAQVKHDHIPLEVLLKAACSKPAEVFGLKKGAIEVGRDADFMVVDPRRVIEIRAKKLHSRCGWTPFEGFEAVFPTATFLRGILLMEDGAIVGERAGRDVIGQRSGTSG
jgi:dihydroorotase